MRSRKSALALTLSANEPADLQAQLAHAEPKQEGAFDIARLTLRLPRATRRELRDLAGSRNVSVNELLAVLIDRGLVGEGRPSIAETAPWFAGYLTRKQPETVEESGADDFG